MALSSERLALRERVKDLPERPGCYLMKDATGQILYVGKAVSIRQRVKSYFQPAERLQPKVRALMRHVADIDVIVTDTEVEALILEATLVKRHQPKYNIQLKDDKAYPYLRITWEEDFPRLLLARRVAETGSRYFGPYPRASTVHETIRLLRRIFPIRNCTNQKFRNAVRPCLEYHIKRCQAPCQGFVDRETYRATMQQVERFLEGHADEVLADLRRRLKAASEALEFERAAELRDQVRAIEALTTQQKVASTAGRELDAIAWASAGADTYVQVFTVREGRLVGREAFELGGTDDQDTTAVAHAFLTQYYERATYIPREILVQALPEDVEALRTWLSAKRGGPVKIAAPRRGEKARLLEMVRHNAEVARDEAGRRVAVQEREREEALLGIQHALGLDRRPRRMECYDISNTQGTESVASMVVFTDGMPDRSQYRRFRIRTVEGPNDFASMAETIRRRFLHQRLAQEADRPEWRRFAETPDLIIVDGGKGQLSAAVAVLQELGVSVPIFGLAKEHEWLFQPGSPDPIVLDLRSPALKMIRYLRDEAHRFAITYHRRLRTRRNLRSVLEDVPGIGPARRRALLARYGSLEAIRQASAEELAELPGMTLKAAETVKEYLSGGDG
jgi:excinuclease ABC subunit C